MSSHSMYYHWRTSDEIAYVSSLGGVFHSRLPRGAKRPSRLEALLAYRRAMDLRTRWEGLDREAIEAAVEKLIAAEMDRIGAPKRPVFVPTNGHGLLAARQYAVPVGEHRREIRRDESGEDE